jgi:predicted nicotinamide N-methyase
MSADDDHGRREERQAEDDPFWNIALNCDANGGQTYTSGSIIDDDCSDDDGENFALGGKITKYALPNSSVVLELAPLAAEDGIWSPVGDHAWYSSALLTSLILQGASVPSEESNEDTEKNYGSNPNGNGIGILANVSAGPEHDTVRVLELGSGAVGLSGIAFAVALSQQYDRFPSWTVTLTDNDKSLLKQLAANVRSNNFSEEIVLPHSDGIADNQPFSETKSICVEYLDWDVDSDDERWSSRNHFLAADVVIGSELAYTHETATALVKVLSLLLDNNPNVQIWIVQVTDRYGWSEIVLPAMESRKNTRIESIPLTYDIHAMASTMIPRGEALDRFAFGAFRISNGGSNQD